MEYTIDYFIKKFEAIPEEKWTVKQYTDSENAHCALGHCGARGYDIVTTIETEESKELRYLFLRNGMNVAHVNDNETFFRSTPKSRILKALYDFKNNQKD
jgi:hypothetical protein